MRKTQAFNILSNTHRTHDVYELDDLLDDISYDLERKSEDLQRRRWRKIMRQENQF